MSTPYDDEATDDSQLAGGHCPYCGQPLGDGALIDPLGELELN